MSWGRKMLASAQGGCAPQKKGAIAIGGTRKKKKSKKEDREAGPPNF